MTVFFLRLDEVMSALQEYPDNDPEKTPGLGYQHRAGMFVTLLSMVSSNHSQKKLQDLLPNCILGKAVVARTRESAAVLYGDYPLYRNKRVPILFSPNRNSSIFYFSKFKIFIAPQLKSAILIKIS